MSRQTQYNTKSRKMLIDYFHRHSNECVSAKQIIESDELKIGEATVYRLLTKLTSQGVLRKSLAREGEGSCYQLAEFDDCDSHFHLKCLDCGSLIHMDCHTMHSLEEHIESEHSFTVDNAFTVIYGHCKGCTDKQNENKNTGGKS